MRIQLSSSPPFKCFCFLELTECVVILVKISCQSTSTDEVKTKRNLLDNASNLLTNFLSGGRLRSMPIAEGAVSDLFDRPLFFSLYDWFLEVLTLNWSANFMLLWFWYMWIPSNFPESWFSICSLKICLIWQHGAVYKLAFGPKAFVVVSDPVVARHILRENAFSFDKVLIFFYNFQFIGFAYNLCFSDISLPNFCVLCREFLLIY